MKKGELTRERLLNIAETGVLSKGFGATSIDEIIAEAEITKSGFFIISRIKTNSPWHCCNAMRTLKLRSLIQSSTERPNLMVTLCIHC